MTKEKYPINIWINEERFEELKKKGLEDKTESVLAGMRRLNLYCDEDQKDRLLEIYPNAKYDSSTTETIELLPPEAKNEMFRLVLEEGSIDIIDDFLEKK